MKCKKCDNLVEEHNTFCVACKKKLFGLNGWLAVFMVVIFIMTVGTILFEIFTSFSLLKYLLVYSFDVFLGWTVFSFFTVSLSVYALLQLSKLANNAIGLIRSVLAISIVYEIASIIMSVALNISDEVSILNKEVFFNTIYGSTACLLYLFYSKRVKTNFPLEKRKLEVIDKLLITATFVILGIFIFATQMFVFTD